MGRSFVAAIEQAPFPPAARRALDWAAGPFLASCAVRAAWRGQLRTAATLFVQGLRRDPLGATAQTASIASARLLERLARARAAAVTRGAPSPVARHFYDFDPTENRIDRTDWFVERRLKRMALLDEKNPPIRGHGATSPRNTESPTLAVK